MSSAELSKYFFYKMDIKFYEIKFVVTIEFILLMYSMTQCFSFLNEVIPNFCANSKKYFSGLINRDEFVVFMLTGVFMFNASCMVQLLNLISNFV
jgi:hypothetical protein